MARPTVCILRAPGTNCDVETAYAFELAGAAAQRVHVNRLLESPAALDAFQMLCLPGGFSYGDDIAAGRILGNQLRRHLADAVRRLHDRGGLILGICNGFQILMKSGLLLLDDQGRSQASLTLNESAKYEDRWVRLRVAPGPCVFFSGIEALYLPVAHAEGKFVGRDPQTLTQLESAGQLALRYLPLGGDSGAGGAATDGDVSYPDNPNGSERAVAGVCDPTGRICGLMPHPERHIDPTHHPQWTRRGPAETGDGLRLFQNAVRFFR